MISKVDLIIAVLAGAIPAVWYYICRWFMSKDAAETKLLDELGAAELTEEQKSQLKADA
jgi:TRAP-type uncharacterized transport system fused permease subunit